MRIKNRGGLTITRTVTYRGQQYTFPTFKLERGEVLDSAARSDADEVRWAVDHLLQKPDDHVSTFKWVLPRARKLAVEIRQLSQGRRVIGGVVTVGRKVNVGSEQ